MNNITKIYLVTNCYDGPNKVYIGKTVNNRKRNHAQTFGENIEYTYIDEVNSIDSKDWKPLECYWIEQFRQWGFEIMNKNKGGGGPSFRSEEFKINLRRISKNKPKPPGFGEAISKLKIGVKFSKEVCLKISKAKKGKKKPQSYAEKFYKPVVQMDSEGNILNTYKSIIHASLSDPRFKPSNISCCLTGVSKSAYGFVWKFT